MSDSGFVEKDVEWRIVAARAPAGARRQADPRWRRVLRAALIVNAAMFLVEMVAGAAAGR